ncbi:armadillo-type protein [Suillus fuscotomentosus]|uniref:Armadillo-type protein n=1 Tax=Suillus fuscotomentosus TaxID=1912939 RepID=A0AAD4HBZ0_9AGAM|nr:armadillo-type protein [Suillus fuscotomentosus]XP_041226683.1 armadillo-type protein [Suillus fuscotomentosus]KAG1889690.1 armadillo-type protein [Suillus fuscotomentosus]KAG1901107.1 armadillo-type protein [Suillus fuscotomentosus]
MDLQSLANLFATTYNPDPNVQKTGELQIRKIGAQEGMLTALLQIIASDGVELATRQACSVYLKNRVRTSYILPPNPRPDHVPIAQSDRTALKANILPLLSASPSRSITVQVAATLKDLVANDFPDRWPSLLDDVKRLLGSGDVREVGAGVVAALECVRAFRFRQKADVLPGIITTLFPTLVTIADGMLNTSPSQPASQEIPAMLHLILKTYKTAIIVNLSPHQQSQESLVPWGRLLFRVVEMIVPVEGVPTNEEDRERCEWWKAKKWAYGILGRLFHRFGNPSQLPSPMQKEYGVFAQNFVTAFAPEIFKVYLHQVELYVSGQAWLGKKCQYQIFQFFTECIKPKSTWILLKPHVDNLVANFAFPQLTFNASKQAMWEADPVEYVRASVDEYENFSSPVSGATSFLLSLASNRTKTSFLPMLQFINTVLRSNPTPAQRFGALTMMSVLGPFIVRHPDVKGSIEQFMVQYVLPEFTSQEPYLRSVACEVLGVVTKAGIAWATEENLNNHSRAVALALDDQELPVRVQAALAITELVVVHDSVRDAVSPQVGKVVQDLLKLSDETDLDILNHSMEAMVDRFQNELMPVASQLTARLCESYLRLAREGLAQQNETLPDGIDVESLVSDGDDDKVYGAMGVAKTIGTVVSCIDSSPEILSQVQEVIIPIIRFTLENKLIDLFDNMYDLVDALTFRLHAISPNMWPVFELTYDLFKSDAVDFLDEMLPSLDNFVSYGTDVLKARPDYRSKVLDMYRTAMTSPQLGDNDKINGCKLAESMLLNLHGHVDDQLQDIVTIAADHIDEGETASFRLANLEILVNTVLYNASAALHFMEAYKPGFSRTFFERWFAAINSDNKLPRVHDKKLSILALCKLLEMEAGAIPEGLRDGWPGIVGGALNIFKGLPQAVAKRKVLEDQLVEGDDDEDEDETKYLNLEGEEDEDVWDEDSAYLEILAKEGARLREKSEKAETGDDESDISEESEIEEELGFFSPLDNINPYVTFKEALQTFQNQNSALYQAATTMLTVERQTVLMEVVTVANQGDHS